MTPAVDPGACPEEQSLAGFVSQRLSLGEAAAIHEHLQSCDACRLVTDVLQAERPNGDASVKPGRRVAHYELREWLGSGGMGSVYAALDTRLNRVVALKVLEKKATGLMHEARAMARLNHPNVATVHDAGEETDVAWLAMELLPGGTLRRWLREPRPTSQLLRVFVDIARGHGHAHAHGLVHRDFKPDNVLFTDGGTPRVADFGLAAEQRASNPREVAGTWAYLAPEAVRGAAPAPAADQYAFGVTLRQALEAGGRAVPRKLKACIARMTAIEPAARFASMDDVAQALEAEQTTKVWRWLAAPAAVLLLLGAADRARAPHALVQSLPPGLDPVIAAEARRQLDASSVPLDLSHLASAKTLREQLAALEALPARGPVAAEALVLSATAAREWRDVSVCTDTTFAALQQLVGTARRGGLSMLEARAWVDLARCQRQRGLLRQAEFSLSVADQVKNGLPEGSLARALISLGRGKLFVHLDRDAEADAALDEVGEVDGWLKGMLLSRRGLLLLATERPADAVATFEVAVPLIEATFGPDDVEALMARHNMASSLTAAGRHEEALALFEREVRESETVSTPLASDLVSVLLALGRREEALAWGRRSLAGVGENDLRPISSMGQQLHAWARAEIAAGDAQAVVDRFEKLRVLEPFCDGKDLHVAERRDLEEQARRLATRSRAGRR
ncbi:MAG: serine/threonine protein kinase [Myxococcaceae bacterium]|nr:serine/threonine protein kinase [Myxococcaceae bacterium]